MNSSGPDKRDNTNAPARSGTQYSWSDSSFPWENRNFDSPDVIVDGLALLYDPTNGTISKGEIFRFGGIKSAGALWDIWFSVGSSK
jgi:hypothetical protein